MEIKTGLEEVEAMDFEGKRNRDRSAAIGNL
jgi:hypothetical protein